MSRYNTSEKPGGLPYAVILLSGFWLSASTNLANGYRYGALPVTAADIDFLAVGVAAVLVAGLAILHTWSWLGWIAFSLGAWLILSPWILGFFGNTFELANAVVTGATILSSATVTLIRTEIDE